VARAIGGVGGVVWRFVRLALVAPHDLAHVAAVDELVLVLHHQHQQVAVAHVAGQVVARRVLAAAAAAAARGRVAPDAGGGRVQRLPGADVEGVDAEEEAVAVLRAPLVVEVLDALDEGGVAQQLAAGGGG